MQPFCLCLHSLFTGLIKQFLTDVDWGELDYLIVDSTPSIALNITIVNGIAGCFRARCWSPASCIPVYVPASCGLAFSVAPPGTSDEHISIVQYLKESTIDGAVVITTPQA